MSPVQIKQFQCSVINCIADEFHVCVCETFCAAMVMKSVAIFITVDIIY